MSNLILPTDIAGAIIPRYPEHERAIQALCQLRDKYPVGSLMYMVLNANAETINRIGGRVDSSLIPDVNTMIYQVVEGYNACAHYAKKDNA